MKKETIYKFLYVVGILLIVGFAVRLGTDYVKYDRVSNSAPFYVVMIERVIEWIVPSIITLIAGKIAKKKYSK